MATYHIEHNTNTKATRDTSRPWLVIKTNGYGKSVHGRYTTERGASTAIARAEGRS